MKLSEFIEKYGDCEVTEDMLDIVNPKGDWKPKLNAEYWYISGGEVFNIMWENDSCDLFYLNKQKLLSNQGRSTIRIGYVQLLQRKKL